MFVKVTAYGTVAPGAGAAAGAPTDATMSLVAEPTVVAVPVTGAVGVESPVVGLTDAGGKAVPGVIVPGILTGRLMALAPPVGMGPVVRQL